MKVYITYPGDASTRFDRAYYRNHHLPLVMKCWEQHGLQGLSAFYPEAAGDGTIAVCICTFRDEAAVRDSFHSSEAPEVMADVKNFTDAVPSQSKLVPLSM